jgi:hypothetical protein
MISINKLNVIKIVTGGFKIIIILVLGGGHMKGQLFLQLESSCCRARTCDEITLKY